MLNKYVLIPLTRGLYSKVDARVAHDLSEFSWHAKRGASGLHLGLFTSEKQAAKAYDEMARKLYGEFATPNFPA